MGIKLLDKINAEQTAKLADKKFPEFRAGDIVRVSVRIKEGEKTRVQDFEGKVLAVDNGRGNASGNFTVSRDSYGVRVEKLFPFNSPAIEKIVVVPSTCVTSRGTGVGRWTTSRTRAGQAC